MSGRARFPRERRPTRAQRRVAELRAKPVVVLDQAGTAVHQDTSAAACQVWWKDCGTDTDLIFDRRSGHFFDPATLEKVGPGAEVKRT